MNNENYAVVTVENKSMKSTTVYLGKVISRDIDALGTPTALVATSVGMADCVELEADGGVPYYAAVEHFLYSQRKDSVTLADQKVWEGLMECSIKLMEVSTATVDTAIPSILNPSSGKAVIQLGGHTDTKGAALSEGILLGTVPTTPKKGSAVFLTPIGIARCTYVRKGVWFTTSVSPLSDKDAWGWSYGVPYEKKYSRMMRHLKMLHNGIESRHAVNDAIMAVKLPLMA